MQPGNPPPPARISVLLPVRDALAFLPEAVGSILSESLPLELIAVDDGSVDGSGAWLDQRAREDSRLQVIHGEPRGIVAALNRGLAEARAPIVARMDADDCSLPGRLGAILERFDAEPGLALAGTGVDLHPLGLLGAGMQRYVSWLNGIQDDDLPREIWVESPLAHPSVGARAAVLRDEGGYREGTFPEDYELLLRLHARGHRLGKIPLVWYLWRDHPGRLTRSDSRYGLEAHRALKVAQLRAGPLRGHERVAVWGAGKTGRAFARALALAGIAIAGWIEVDPRKIGRDLRGAPIRAVGQLEAVRGTPLVVAVGVAEARPLIRAELGRHGFVELRDFWVVA